MTVPLIASGVGLAVAERLAQTGWNIAIFDLNFAQGVQVATSLGENAIFVRGNAAVYDDQVKVFTHAWRKWGQVDLGMFF